MIIIVLTILYFLAFYLKRINISFETLDYRFFNNAEIKKLPPSDDLNVLIGGISNIMGIKEIQNFLSKHACRDIKSSFKLTELTFKNILLTNGCKCFNEISIDFNLDGCLVSGEINLGVCGQFSIEFTSLSGTIGFEYLQDSVKVTMSEDSQIEFEIYLDHISFVNVEAKKAMSSWVRRRLMKLKSLLIAPKGVELLFN